MEQTSFTERLMEFGLTRQEASIYQCLLTEGKVTGYEVAKQTGISRSNAYNSGLKLSVFLIVFQLFLRKILLDIQRKFTYSVPVENY